MNASSWIVLALVVSASLALVGVIWTSSRRADRARRAARVLDEMEQRARAARLDQL